MAHIHSRSGHNPVYILVKCPMFDQFKETKMNVSFKSNVNAVYV